MDKMREGFERWADGEGLFIDGGGTKGYPSMATQGAWQAWQHLSPMVEALRDAEGKIVELCEAFDVPLPQATLDRISTAKARLEGKDD